MYPNFWRGVVLTQGLFVFVMTLVIVIKYSLALSRAQRIDRALPLHIVTIATSYLFATAFVAIEILNHWDNSHLTYRTPFGGAIFILGDAGLVFMLIHIEVQRKYIGRIREHVMSETESEKKELASELKHQTEGLAADIKEVGRQAQRAYNEANAVNEKIANIQTTLSDAQVVSETKIDELQETGKDTNTRVRRIEPKVVKEPRKRN